MSDFSFKLLLSLGLGVVGGTALGFTPMGWQAAILAGMLLTVISEMFLVLLAHEKARQVNLAILNLTKTLPHGVGFSSFMTQAVISSLQHRRVELLQKGIEVQAREVPRFWTASILNIESSLEVATFIGPEHWWEKPYSEANVAAQKSKAAEGKSITRIFIWDTPEELERIRPFALDQKESGIAVAHVSLGTIDSDSKLAALVRELGTPDVALIDGRWAVFHHLDPETRDTERLVLSSDPEDADRIRRYLSLLKPMAEPF